MNFVIGDIHGEISKLRALIRFILRFDENPTLTFIGDYLDKGENPKEVIEFLVHLSIKYQCIFLKGNHEFIWMEDKSMKETNYLLKYGGFNTIESLSLTNIQDTEYQLKNSYGSFFNDLKPYHIVGNYFICHSGVKSDYFEIQPEKINESAFYFNRYSFLCEKRKYLSKYTIIFGHTGFMWPYVDKVKIGIDTAACFMEDQPLTSFCIETKMFFNSNQRNYSIKSLPSICCPIIPRIEPWRIKKQKQ